MDAQESVANRYGFVWNIFGGVRLIPEVYSVHKYIQSAGIRQAGNVKIQSSAAELMRLALAELRALLVRLRKDYGVWCWMLLTIHDEIIVEVQDDWADTVLIMMQEIMDNVMVDKRTGVNLCRVPIKSEGHVLSKWTKD